MLKGQISSMATATSILQHQRDSLIIENHSLEQQLSRIESKVGQLNNQGFISLPY